jgi:hypothetical protein
MAALMARHVPARHPDRVTGIAGNSSGFGAPAAATMRPGGTIAHQALRNSCTLRVTRGPALLL